MKAVIYARVSTEDQDLSNQTTVLREIAARRDMEIIEIYQEKESAWKNGHQQELRRLIEDARRRKFDVVLVWALDRLSREGPLAILTLSSRLGKCNVQLISYQEPWIETAGEMKEFFLTMTGWVARYESNRKSERTKAGMARARKEGKQIGRPKGSKDKTKRARRGYFLRHAK